MGRRTFLCRLFFINFITIFIYFFFNPEKTRRGKKSFPLSPLSQPAHFGTLAFLCEVKMGGWGNGEQNDKWPRAGRTEQCLHYREVQVAGYLFPADAQYRVKRRTVRLYEPRAHPAQCLRKPMTFAAAERIPVEQVGGTPRDTKPA